MASKPGLEKFINQCSDLMSTVSSPNMVLLHKKYENSWPEDLNKQACMMPVFVMVGVALARLEYPDTTITQDLERLRLLYEDSQKDGYNTAFELLERRYQEAKLTQEKKKKLTKKLEEMNQVIDQCNSTPFRRSCLCAELECLVPFCGRRVAGHGYLICDRHHDAYCDSDLSRSLLDWAASKL
jgi:hypothetical protein